jgi:tRNA threonylcarbamoyladenosine biosynthesis protein TsaB
VSDIAGGWTRFIGRSLVPGDKTWLLAIDTATERAAIAVYDGSALSELMWNAGRNQTQALLGQIEHLLALNGLGFDRLGAIGVASGPGSFNGLRVGLSTAKGLCFGLSIPIIGVDTLEVAAYPHLEGGTPVRAFVPAGRGRAVSADFRQRNDRWVRSGSMRQQPISALAAGLTELTTLAGELTPEQRAELASVPHVRTPAAARCVRRAGYLAEIAYERWQRQDNDDLVALEPSYVHGTSKS